MMIDDERYVDLIDRLTAVEKELVSVTEAIKHQSQRLDEVVITQLKDHGHRLHELERRQVYLAGFAAGAGAVAGAIGAAVSAFIRGAWQ